MKAKTRLILVLLLASPLWLSFQYRPLRVRILARLGNAEAMRELGDAYMTVGGDGLLVRSDPVLAYYWLEASAERGNTSAMWALFNMNRGDFYHYSPRIQKWLPRAAEAGHLPSMIELSKAFQYGLYGFPKDPKLAKEWIDKIKKVPHHW
jgi:TPR repeat protein